MLPVQPQAVAWFHGLDGVCWSCSMDALIGDQLKLRNIEVAALTTKVEAAESQWLSATDLRQKHKLVKVYEDAKKDLKDCHQRRGNLQLKLPNAGESADSIRLDLFFHAYKQPTSVLTSNPQGRMRSGLVKGEHSRVLHQCAQSRMADEAGSTILACVGQPCLSMRR